VSHTSTTFQSVNLLVNELLIFALSCHSAKLVRALMYAGFEVVHPGVLAQADPKYLILGMEL